VHFVASTMVGMAELVGRVQHQNCQVRDAHRRGPVIIRETSTAGTPISTVSRSGLTEGQADGMEIAPDLWGRSQTVRGARTAAGHCRHPIWVPISTPMIWAMTAPGREQWGQDGNGADDRQDEKTDETSAEGRETIPDPVPNTGAGDQANEE